MEIATLLQHVFNRSSLNDIPLSALEDLTQKHPYFSAGHYFLSKKLGQENKDSAEYSRQKQKTNLYFHDTLWLHHLLNGSAGESAPLLNTEWEKAADTVEKNLEAWYKPA